MLNKFKKKNNNKGSTLVELLVVIAIIGILAVVAVPSLFKQIDKSKGADIAATVGTIKTATTAYYADNGDVPTGIELAADATVPTTGATTLLEAGYLDGTPNGDDDVQYSITKDGKTAELTISIVANYLNEDAFDKLLADIGAKADDVTGTETTASKIKVTLVN